METRVQLAGAKPKQGYNCAQAVACTYCDLVGLDEKTMFRLAEGFGSGMGCTNGTCGAISAACALAGLKNSTANLEAPDSKLSTYALSGAMMNAFEEKIGSSVCREIKGLDTGKPLCSCLDCILDAARIAEEVLFTK